MTKVILIEPYQEPKIIDYNDSVKYKLFGNAVIDFIALRAPKMKI